MLETQVDAVRDFIQERVCTGLEFKKPYQQTFKVKWLPPVAYSVFEPPPKDNDGNLAIVPNVVIFPLKGEDDTEDGTVTMGLVFTLWDPGTRLPEAEKYGLPEYLKEDNAGWRALATFMDRTRRAFYMNPIVGDMEVLFPVKYGLFVTEDWKPFVDGDYFKGYMEVTFEYQINNAYDESVRKLLE